ncbi:unnamed protein product, partial [Rotaria sordida]
VNVHEKRSKVVSSIMNNLPFRDLLNHLSWSSTLLIKQQNEEKEEKQQQQINDVIIIV